VSSEKTEKATPKRREDAKRKGQIARGAELPAAAAFLAGLFAVNYFSRDLFANIGEYIKSMALKVADPQVLTVADVQGLFIEATKILGLSILPIIAVALAAGLAGNFAQGGLIFTTEALMPKADKFNPASNIKKIFGLDSVINLLKSALKLVLLGAVGYSVLSPVVKDAPTLIHAPVATIVTTLGETIYSLALRCGMAMFVIALADYGYTLYKHEKSLKMSKQEIRDEYKEQEGDPMVKGQRRQRARQLVQNRSMAEVPTASVIITNPTHFSVALRYDKDKDAAPVVVAKGVDHLAFKIREIAKENDVTILENPPLARALYRLVEPGQIIPTEFFGAVAEILAYVFRQNENKVKPIRRAQTSTV
jgi:flagellar biosynthesis protein FlhB